MKNNRTLLYTTSLVLSISLLLSGCTFFQTEPEKNSEMLETESEIYWEEESETQFYEIETEESTETLVPIIQTPLSYNEQIKLDFVEQPKKRSREEAIAKIKELSRWYPALYFVYKNADLYETEMLLSGAGNPEMADFLYGYLSSDGSVTGGFTEEETPETYPLFLQFDPRWGYMAYGSEGNMGSSGCGPTCLSMAVYYLTGDRNCTPDVVARYSLDNGYYVKGVGTAWSLLANYPRTYGLSSRQISWSEANLKAQLDKGNILICSVRLGKFTSSGHFIVIYGYDETGFKINDPKCVYRSDLTWDYEEFKNDIKATWTIGK
ncbi:MAG: C39 family peptidase [Roseburia sp.]|nr:C39 family peptidase [Roseburia sp.]